MRYDIQAILFNVPCSPPPFMSVHADPLLPLLPPPTRFSSARLENRPFLRTQLKIHHDLKLTPGTT